jgi:hypothetical protein
MRPKDVALAFGFAAFPLAVLVGQTPPPRRRGPWRRVWRSAQEALHPIHDGRAADLRLVIGSVRCGANGGRCPLTIHWQHAVR